MNRDGQRRPASRSRREGIRQHARRLRGKTHLATGFSFRACQAGHRVQFATASQWVARLAEALTAGRLQDELTRPGRCPLLVIDEVGYIPFHPRPPTCSSNSSDPATSAPA